MRIGIDLGGTKIEIVALDGDGGEALRRRMIWFRLLRYGIVSAPNKSIALRIAEMQFVNATIHKISELTPPEDETRFPGARFINGEFRPVVHQDEVY